MELNRLMEFSLTIKMVHHYSLLIAFSLLGDIVFSEFHSHYIRKIATDGSFSVVAGTGALGKEDGKVGIGTIYSPAGLCLDQNVRRPLFSIVLFCLSILSAGLFVLRACIHG
jgi:hypothetical protein